MRCEATFDIEDIDPYFGAGFRCSLEARHADEQPHPDLRRHRAAWDTPDSVTGELVGPVSRWELSWEGSSRDASESVTLEREGC